MTCEECGAPTAKRICHECSLEGRFGVPSDYEYNEDEDEVKRREQ